MKYEALRLKNLPLNQNHTENVAKSCRKRCAADKKHTFTRKQNEEVLKISAE